MELLLPTQYAPTETYEIGGITIAPFKTVTLEKGGTALNVDSMHIDSGDATVGMVNEWMIFHAFLLQDANALMWYESIYATDTGKLPIRGECTTLKNYADLAGTVYFLDKFEGTLEYGQLYEAYSSTSDENKTLVKSFLNTYTDFSPKSTERSIRNDRFNRVLIAFSLVEAMLGENPKCEGTLSCSKHGEIPLKHNSRTAKDWLKERLLAIVKKDDIAAEYLEVVWEVRQNLRHKTAHTGAVSDAKHILQAESDKTYHWIRTSEEWERNSAALLDLTLRMNSVTRYLLLDEIFGFGYFPSLRNLQSKRIEFGGELQSAEETP